MSIIKEALALLFLFQVTKDLFYLQLNMKKPPENSGGQLFNFRFLA